MVEVGVGVVEAEQGAEEMDLFLNMKMVVGTATGAILEVGVGEEDAVSEAVGEGDTMDLMRTCCKMEATIMIHLLKAVVEVVAEGGEIVEGAVDLDLMGRSRQLHEMLVWLSLFQRC